MRLRKECEHDRYDAHQWYPFVNGVGVVCPGGEFLPEGALVIEKVEGEWPAETIGALTYLARPRIPSPQEVSTLLDVLADGVMVSEERPEPVEQDDEIGPLSFRRALATHDALASQVGESERKISEMPVANQPRKDS